MSIDDFRTNLDCLQSFCASDGSQDLLVGDFNLPHIDWLNGHIPNDCKSEEFYEFSIDFGLTQLNRLPTRKLSVLDLVLTTNPLLISDLITDVPFCQSDHDSVLFSMHVCCKVENKKCSEAQTKLAWK